MPHPAAGLWIWIWEWWKCDAGRYDAIAARVKSVGARGVIVKAADGGRWFKQGVPITVIVDELRARGIEVATWDYCYGSDPGRVFYSYAVAGYTEERNRAVETITLAKPAFHMLDIEGEWEGQVGGAQRAGTFMDSLHAGIPAGFPVGYAPLPSIRNHLALPYRQFTMAGAFMVPQLYWSGLGWTVDKTCSEFYADAGKYDLTGQPILPAYEDAAGEAEASDADATRFGDLLVAQGAVGTSVWSYQHLNAAGWARAARLAARFAAPAPAPAPVPSPTPDATRLRSALQTIADTAGAALEESA